MKIKTAEGKTTVGKTLRNNSHAVLHLLRLLLMLLFCIGVYLAVAPITRHLFIVVFVPIYASICIFYSYLFLKSNPNSLVPSKDEIIEEVPAVISPIVVEVDTTNRCESPDSGLSVTNASTKPNSLPEGGFLSILPETLYGKATYMRSCFSNALRSRLYPVPPCAPPGSLLTDVDDSILTDEEDNLSQIPLTEDQLAIPDGSYSESERSNLSGTFKLVKSNNFDSFLKALGVSWTLRKAASLAKPVHTYTHEEDTFRVQIDGVIKGDTTFIINGPPVKSAIRHIKFLDKASYLDSGDGILVRKVAQNPAADDPTELMLRRILTSDKSQIILKSKAIYRDGSESLESEQIFQRQQGK